MPSAAKKALQYQIMRRQEYVATLMLRGMTQSKITEVLGNPKLADGAPNPYLCINPKTGKGYDISRICRDMQEITARWQERAMAAMDEHRARQLAELSELKKRAWANEDFDMVLKTVQTEMKLLGTAAPEQVEMRGRVDVNVEQLSDDELNRIASGDNASGRRRRVITPPPSAFKPS